MLVTCIVTSEILVQPALSAGPRSSVPAKLTANSAWRGRDPRTCFTAAMHTTQGGCGALRAPNHAIYSPLGSALVDTLYFAYANSYKGSGVIPCQSRAA